MPEEVVPVVEAPQYLTKDEFSKSAAYFRRVAEENASLKEMLSAVIEKGEDGVFKLKATTAPVVVPKDKAPEWQVEMNAMKSELKKRDDLIAEKDKKFAESSKRAAIIDALSKSNAVNPQRDAVHIFDSVKTNSEGKYVSYSKDENGLDVETGLDVFVGSWLKGNPELVRASGKSGSGTPNGHVNVINRDDMTMDQYAAARKAGKIELK
jgi:hypothetical protein